MRVDRIGRGVALGALLVVLSGCTRGSGAAGAAFEAAAPTRTPCPVATRSEGLCFAVAVRNVGGGSGQATCSMVMVRGNGPAIPIGQRVVSAETPAGQTAQLLMTSTATQRGYRVTVTCTPAPSS